MQPPTAGVCSYGTVGANIEDPPFLSTETEKGLAQVVRGAAAVRLLMRPRLL